MVKKMLFGIVVMALISTDLVQAGEKLTAWIENKNITVNGDTVPGFDGIISYDLTPRVGAFLYYQWAEPYSQFYAGPTLWIIPSVLQIGVAGGAEEASDSHRFGSFLWSGYGKASFLSIWETGGSGDWYKAEFNYAITDHIGVGAMTQRFVGAGPRLEYKIPGSPITLWGGPMWNWERPRPGRLNAMTGVRVNLW